MTWVKVLPEPRHATPHLDERGWCRCSGICCIDGTDGRCKCRECACFAAQGCQGESGSCARCRPFAFQASP